MLKALIRINASSKRPNMIEAMEWATTLSAPYDRDLELAVIDRDGVHALVFPCRRILDGWVDADSRRRIDVRPTHWREWEDGRTSRAFSSPEGAS
jgi:hypothetical protein